MSWDICIDTGGTFTDCLACDPAGGEHRAKVLSHGGLRGRVRRREGRHEVALDEQWGAAKDLVAGFTLRRLGGERSRSWRVRGSTASPVTLHLADPADDLEPGTVVEVISDEPAPLLAARLVTRTPAGAALPEIRMRLASTWGTNALLERRGAPTALFITRGFGDLLEIGDQQRPDLFAITIRKRDVPCAAVVEVDERIAADGTALAPLDLDAARRDARAVLESGVTSAAVALLHGYRNPEHEDRLAGALRELGFRHVSCSAALAPLIKLVPRARTALVDAYLAPIIGAYLGAVRRGIPCGRLHLMTSAGGLVGADDFHPKDSLLSGPAGGVAGAAAAGRRSGVKELIGFDMGGTSTDVARYHGDFIYRFQHGVGDVQLMAPALAIETVAAGGGSICHHRGDRLQVGPESAGASPGPACYGGGGPLTVTDVNLLSGRLDPARFEIPLDTEAARTALAAVMQALPEETDTDAALDGFLQIADERMAAAVERISIREGDDPAPLALVAFGGAGGQHACAVAARLGMSRVLVPDDAALLSAAGLRMAVIERFAQRQVLGALDDVEAALPGWLEDLAAEACRAVVREGVPPGAVTVRRRIVNMRITGQDATLTVETDPADWRRDFAARYRATYGHAPPARPIEIESIRVVASSARPAHDAAEAEVAPFPADPVERRPARFDGRWIEVPVFEGADLAPGAELSGPALVFTRRTGIVVDEGWRAHRDGAGALVLRRNDAGAALAARPARPPEVVQRELFTHRFTAIAEDMGQVLERTALSTNVKERLDFSCTVLDAEGELVVNAPHMPVHLGAMGLCVRALRKAIRMEEGDVVVTNHPAFGGSHLPDITVVTPVFDLDGAPVGFVASRAHHAEIGGTRPGSMPPAATTLAEEGVVIEPMHLVDAGRPRWDAIETKLRAGPFPSRAVADNLADLRAQMAANQRGVVALRALAARYGAAEVARHLRLIKERAERVTRAALAAWPDGTYRAEEHLDDGAVIRVAVRVSGSSAAIDFTGSAGTHPGNLNATPAIVRSAVIYVLRLLLGRDGVEVPLNEGIMRAVEVVIPPGLLDPPFPDEPALCPAVVGGNVETSQRLVDTLLKAFGLVACSQGTMNNTLFGTERFGYYETVCGGTGAAAEADGADAVHSHMTNTRITDPEILEHRYPVRLVRFAIRRGSGGAGRRCGGDGVVRELRFLAPMSVSILSQHRTVAPYGLEGGEPGAPGRQRIVRTDGTEVTLGPIDGAAVEPGDRLIVETPGGGGFGRKE